MKIKKLLKVNLINIGILGVVFVFHFVTGKMFSAHDGTGDMSNLTNLISMILLLGWAAFTIYSNVVVVKEDSIEEKQSLLKLRDRVKNAGRKDRFQNERRHMLDMIESIQSREGYFMSDERDERVRELYILTQNQLKRNLTNAAEYMESFDYVTGKDSGYLQEMCGDTQYLLDRFNKLAELSVTFDDTSLDYDTQEIEDMTESLELMRKTGKAKLES